MRNNNFLSDARKWLHEGMEEAKGQAAKEILRQEFENLDLKEITKKDKKQLILWRSRYPEDSPQYQFATHELGSRSSSLKLKVIIGIAIFNAIVAITIALWKFQS